MLLFLTHTLYHAMQGVRDVTFSNDGRRFISTGYDKNIRVWDTETGQVIRTLNTGKVGGHDGHRGATMTDWAV